MIRLDRVTVALLGIAVAWHSGDLQASDYQLSEEPPPESVQEIEQSRADMGREFIRDPRVIFRPIDEWRKTKSPFFRDGQLKYDFRTYYFEADRPVSEPEAWTGGGELAFRSGKYRDFLSIGASWYNSFKLSGNSESNESLLLQTDDSNISVLGQAFVELHWKSLNARLYRQELNLPYINRFDNRMLPNTFEAYGVGRDGTSLDFIVAQVDKIKRRFDDEFISMSEAAGAESTSNGVTVSGINWHPDESDFELGFTNQWSKDLFNTFYTEASWTHDLSKVLGFKVSGQYTDQRSSGKQLIGDFDTDTWGVSVASSYNSAVATLAFTQTDEGGHILSPYGGRPSYLSMMIRDFDRANERAWRTGLSYHFIRFGMPDVSAVVNMVKGRHARDSLTGQKLRDQSEYDYTLDYKPSRGPLEGFWLRTRYAKVRVDGLGKVTDELRIILNYSLPIL